MPLARSLRGLQSQMPPVPKGRLSVPVPAPRGTHNCATRRGAARGCRPVAPGRGTSKAGSLPGPGGAAPISLRPWRGGVRHRLGHVARRPAAAKPQEFPVLGRCSLQGGNRFGGEACLPASVPWARAQEPDSVGVRASASAQTGCQGTWEDVPLQLPCRLGSARAPHFNPCRAPPSSCGEPTRL